MLQVSIEPNFMAVRVNMKVNKNYSFYFFALHYSRIRGKLNILYTFSLYKYEGYSVKFH
jgi:hypothetical protein